MINKSKKTKSSTHIDSDTLKTLIKLLEKSVRDKSTSGCWYSNLKPNGRGHVQIKYKGVRYLGHRIMAFSKSNPPIYVPYDPTTKIEASHLCGDPKCIRPDHLHLENTLVNQTRDCCRMFGEQKGYFCPHKPACIGCNPVSHQ